MFIQIIRIFKIRQVLICLTPLFFISCNAQQNKVEKKVGGACDGCDLIFSEMPSSLNYEDTLPDWNEPGQKMIISGKVFKLDGKTPAAGVILYFYHTDSRGYYSSRYGDNKDEGHGHIRGWIKTNDKGEYKIYTTRPAPYPNRENPEHIHVEVKEEGLSVYWIDSFVFDDDPLLSDNFKNRQYQRGGSGICHLTKDDEERWICKRNIVLGKNVPNYK